jgi:fructose-1,6-bisphosphatase/inositol monophosphatase family enzyme
MVVTSTEASVLAALRTGDASAIDRGSVEPESWVPFCLLAAARASALVREARAAGVLEDAEAKADGSPLTATDREAERLIREMLAECHSNVAVVGEEDGGEMDAEGLLMAIDPVDGTWAFMAGVETYSTTIAFFQDGTPVLGVVANPATAQIAYSTAAGPARVLSLSAFGEPDRSRVLPERADAGTLLVNLHPTQKGDAVGAALYEAWSNGTIQQVRSPGGSPCWAMVEAARGHHVYVNLWSRRPAKPYDLPAGALIVRGAGGHVVDLEGAEIDAGTHSGPFLAAVDKAALETVASIVRSAL